MTMRLDFDGDCLIIRDEGFSGSAKLNDTTGPWLRDMLESRWPSTTYRNKRLDEPTEPGLYIPTMVDDDGGRFFNYVLVRDVNGYWRHIGGRRWDNDCLYVKWDQVVKELPRKYFPLRRLKIAED